MSAYVGFTIILRWPFRKIMEKLRIFRHCGLWILCTPPGLTCRCFLLGIDLMHRPQIKYGSGRTRSGESLGYFCSQDNRRFGSVGYSQRKQLTNLNIRIIAASLITTLLASLAVAQNTAIASPSNGATVVAGSSIVVGLNRPVCSPNFTAPFYRLDILDRINYRRLKR